MREIFLSGLKGLRRLAHFVFFFMFTSFVVHLKVAIDAGKDLFRMSVSPDTGSLVATGGKENTLKLWDGTRPDAGALFQARNVSNISLFLIFSLLIHSQGKT